MAKPMRFEGAADSEELQALFDSIAAEASAAPPATAANGDSPELAALFDSVAAGKTATREEAEAASGAVYTRLGKMTRELHESLRQLGYDRMLQEAVAGIPDARERLTYIAQMTEQAASRVLNAIDIATPIQDGLHSRAGELGERWEQVYGGAMAAADFKELAAATHEFLRQVGEQAAATKNQLHEIMMAQDFQDLTGQVIKKVVDMAQCMEGQLVQLLFEAMPSELRAGAPTGLLNGPVINGKGGGDVVRGQAQVDALLDSLGF